MKKRILSLMLAAITILQLFSTFTLPTLAEDGATISVEEMVVGKRYRAVIKTEAERGDLYMGVFGISDGAPMVYSYVTRTTLPQELIIIKAEEFPGYVYVMNESWRSSEAGNLDAYRYIEAAEIHILECLDAEPEPEPSSVGLTVNGEAVSQLTLAPGDKTYVFTDLAGEISEGAASYQWQMMSPGDSEWVNIKDYFYPYAIITDALIENATNAEGVAFVRCVVTDGIETLVSSPMAVTKTNNAVSYDYPAQRNITPMAMSAMSAMVAAATGASTEPNEPAGVRLLAAGPSRAVSSAFNIGINYIFLHKDNKEKRGTAAEAFTVSPPQNTTFTGDIISPPVVGYAPYVESTDGTFDLEYDGMKLDSANIVSFNEQATEIVVTVYYVPKEVSYRVKYFKQNLADDEYTEWKTVYKTGTADTEVGAGLNPTVSEMYAVGDNSEIEKKYGFRPSDITGFEPLAYEEKANISSDGGTVIEVYYDRIYYLVKYELGEGYGVMPNYVRYGTNVMPGNPTNPGYTFDGWQLTSVDGDTENLADYPQYNVTAANTQIKVANNLVYTAKWKVSTTTYTIIYWLENADNGGFTLDSFDVVESAIPGSVIDASDTLDLGGEEEHFVFLDTMSDKQVVIKGDGTTSINVYYARKYYSINFTSTGRCALYIENGNANYSHTHGSNCERDLLCTKEIHTHTDACGDKTFICTIEEHTAHTKACCITSTNGHVHTTTCYGSVVSTTPTTGYYVNDAPKNAVDGQIYRYSSYGSSRYYIYIGGSWYRYNNTNVTGGAVISPSGTNCPVVHINSDHATGTCVYADSLHTHNDSDCYAYAKCKVISHVHSDGCYGECKKYEHTCGTNCSNANRTNSVKVVTQKYDSDISTIWPIVDASGTSHQGYVWESSKTGDYYSILYKMPDGNMTMARYQFSGSTKYHWYYALERLTPATEYEGGNYVTSNGKYYYVAFDTYLTAGNSTNLTYDEDYFPITGFTQLQSKNQWSSKWTTNGSYKEQYLYYVRNSYSLIFNDGVKEIAGKTESILYEADISGKYFVPDIPSNKEANSVEFAGWYTTPTCADGTEFDFTGQIMPARDLTLYAKWEPTVWSVKVYMDEAKTIFLDGGTVEFGERFSEPDYKTEKKNREEYKDLIFNGWYYNDGGSDIRFDFNTMSIKRDYVIFAKWTSHVPVNFTVRYVVVENDEYVDIADPTNGVALVGVTKSFTAKAGDELYEKYQTCLPTVRAQSIEIKSIASENKVLFVYENYKEKNITYTVKHIFYDDKLPTNPYVIQYNETVPCSNTNFSGKLSIPFYTSDAEGELEDIATANGVWDTIVKLSPHAYYQELILVADSSSDANEVVFEWADRGVAFIYQVVHHLEKEGNVDANDPKGYTAVHYEEFLGTYDGDGKGTVNAELITEQGFSVNESISTLTDTFEKTEQSITSPRVLNVYYSRDTLSYEIQYITDKEMFTDSGTAKYGSDVTVEAKNIPGYKPKKESQTVTITQEGQLILFYYDPMEVIFNYSAADGGGASFPVQEKIHVNESSAGSTPEALPGYYFEGWYTDKDCTIRVDSSWVDSDGTLRPIPSVDDAGTAINFYAKFAPASLTISNANPARSDQTAAPEWVAMVDNADQGFIYVIKGDGVNLRVALGGYASKTILGLPAGSYTITIESSWSWRYESVSCDGASVDTDGDPMKFSLVFDGKSMTVSFTADSPGQDNPAHRFNDGYYITNQAHN